MLYFSQDEEWKHYKHYNGNIIKITNCNCNCNLQWLYCKFLEEIVLHFSQGEKSEHNKYYNGNIIKITIEISQTFQSRKGMETLQSKQYKHYNGNIVNITMEISQIPQGNCVIFQSM